MGKIARPIRLICTGFLTLFFYAIPIGWLIRSTLGFNIFSPQSLLNWVHDFKFGYFVANDIRTWLVLLMVVFFYPLGIIIWIFMFRFKMTYKVKSVFDTLKVKSNQIQTTTPQPDTPEKTMNRMSFKPAKMPFQNLGDREAASDPDQSVELTPATRNENDVQTILKITSNLDVNVFKNLKLGNFSIPVSVATNEKAFLISLVNQPDCHWAVDMEESDQEESFWFSEGGRLPSPVKNVLGCAAELKKIEPLAIVFPIIAISDGEILDTDSVVPFLKDKGIRLVRFSNGMPDSLTQLETLLASEFPPKATAHGDRS